MNKGIIIFGVVIFIFIGSLVYMVRDATSTLDQANTDPLENTPVATPEPVKPAPPPVTEQDLSLCEVDSDCLIVPYKHCCGTTKRAINQKWSDVYYGHPEWQTFDNKTLCAVIGQCPSDAYIATSTCEVDGSVRRCRLKF